MGDSKMAWEQELHEWSACKVEKTFLDVSIRSLLVEHVLTFLLQFDKSLMLLLLHSANDLAICVRKLYFASVVYWAASSFRHQSCSDNAMLLKSPADQRSLHMHAFIWVRAMALYFRNMEKSKRNKKVTVIHWNLKLSFFPVLWKHLIITALHTHTQLFNTEERKEEINRCWINSIDLELSFLSLY